MIETKIDELIQAINRLTEALNNAPVRDEADQTPTPEEQVLEKVLDAVSPPPKKARKAKATLPEPEAPAPAPEPELHVAEPVPAAEAPALTVADLREIAQKALDSGHLQEVIALNKEYGLKRISDADPAKYAEIIAKLKGIIHGAP